MPLVLKRYFSGCIAAGFTTLLWHLVHVVWTYLMEDTATVIESVWTSIIIPITTAALTIPVKLVMWALKLNFNQGDST